MIHILISNIKKRLFSLGIYIASAVAFIWMYVSLFPAFAEQAPELEKLLESFPQGFLEAFGFEGGLFFDSIENFLATEMFSFIWPIMTIAIGVGIAGSAIAGEIENNTIETLLAQPISRIKLFLVKYLSGLFNLIIFVFATIYSIIPLSILYNIKYQTKNYFFFALVSLLFSWAIYSISLLISSISSKKGLVSFISVGIIILMYVTNIISTLKDSLEDLKYISFFHYFDPASLLAKGEVIDYSYLIFGGIILITSIVACCLFNRRDISV